MSDKIIMLERFKTICDLLNRLRPIAFSEYEQEIDRKIYAVLLKYGGRKL